MLGAAARADAEADDTADKPTRAPADTSDQAETGSDSPLQFRINRVFLDLDAEYQFRRVERNRIVGRRRRTSINDNHNLLMEEALGLRFDGELFRPEFLQFNGEIELGLSQSRFEEDYDNISRRDDDGGGVSRFDINVSALIDQPVSFQLYARRHDNRLPRRFLPSLRDEETAVGLSALGTFDDLTLELGWDYTDSRRRGARSNLDDEDLTTWRIYLDGEWKIEDGHTLKFRYDREEEDSTYQGSDFNFDTMRDKLTLEHELLFGLQQRHVWSSFLRFNEEEGDLARDEIEFSTRLNLRHHDRFSTAYRYSYDRFEADGLQFDTHRGDVSATWRPTNPLRLTWNGYGMFERFDEGVDTTEYGTGLDVAYRRPTPWGELTANLALAYDRSRTTGGSGVRFVRDELIVLDDVRLTSLRQVGVLHNSVQAHNLTRTRYYAEGLDYELVFRDGRAQVRRLPTGRIADGEGVYFDYKFERSVKNTINTYHADVIIEHAFDFGLTPYYAFDGRFEDFDDTSPTLPFLRDIINRHRLGVRYDQSAWGASAEFELFDDSVEPYKAGHVTGRWSILRQQEHALDVSAELSRYEFSGGVDARDVWWFDADVTDEIWLGRNLFLRNGLAYRFENDSKGDRMHGVDLESTLAYSKNYLNVELTVEYDLLTLTASEEQGFGVFLNIRRDLSHLLPDSWVR